ncbi:MAG: class I SAM-dependent methyltransferase [Gammaproteobacteria bacterium]|nr:class I SAM-dependent methyltransferase [Gammaproteobacteria bacterium]
MDFSSSAVDIANSKAPDAEIYEGNAQSLPFSDDTFDAVVCGFEIIHLPDPQKG